MNAVFILRIFLLTPTQPKIFINFCFHPGDIPILPSILSFFMMFGHVPSLLYSVTEFCLRFYESRLESDRMNFVFRFLPALITAVLTNHLAWVPTVMPNGQPPIKIFLEKHSSQSVDMLAKTHPYNPLWAQLGMYSENAYIYALYLDFCVTVWSYFMAKINREKLSALFSPFLSKAFLPYLLFHNC